MSAGAARPHRALEPGLVIRAEVVYNTLAVPETNEQNRSRLIVFRATPAEQEAIEQRATREQLTISEVLRRAVAHYLEQKEYA